MKAAISNGLLLFGAALVGASALRALINLLQTDPFDPWAAVLAAGCILMSIGLGLRKRV